MLLLLGKSEYGLYNIASTLISYVNLLNMGFSSSYVRFYTRKKASGNKDAVAQTNGLFVLVFIFIGILALVSGFVLIGFVNVIFGTGLTDVEIKKAKIIMTILTISTAYNLGTSIFSSIVVANEKFIFHKTVNLIKTILSPSLTWIMLLMGYKSIAMSLVTAVLTVTADTFYLVYCFTVLKIDVKMKSPQLGQLKEITVFSSFIAVTIIVDQVNWSVDKIILGRFLGTAYTAVYSVAATIQNLYTQMSTAISNVFVPRVNELVAENNNDNKLDELFVNVGKMQGLVLIPILLGFIFLGRSFIRLWAPDGYDQAYYIALILMLSSTIPYMQNIGITIQMAKNKHKFRAVLYSAMALVNFGLSILLCKKYGALGVSFGTAISLILCNGIIMNIYYRKSIGLNMAAFWKSMAKFLPTIAVLSVYGVLINIILNIDGVGRLLASGFIFLTVYLVMIWISFLEKNERKRILLALHNRRKRV